MPATHVDRAPTSVRAEDVTRPTAAGAARESLVHTAVLSRSALAALVILLIVGAVTSPQQFLTTGNLNAVLLFWPVVAIVACGQLVAIMSGGIDLSLAGVFSLTGATVMTLTASGWGSASILVGLAVGVGCGIVNGLIIGVFRVVPLAATLATMFLFGGIADYITHGNTLYGSPGLLRNIVKERFLGLPLTVFLAGGVLLVLAVWLYRSVVGLRVRAFGDLSSIEQVAGVPRRRVLLWVYGVAGTLTALAALLQMGALNSYYPSAGSGLLLPAVAAAALGGASLTGGSGSVFGTAVAAVVLALVNNVFDILGFSPEWHQIGFGVVVLLALGVERLSHQWRRREREIEHDEMSA